MQIISRATSTTTERVVQETTTVADAVEAVEEEEQEEVDTFSLSPHSSINPFQVSHWKVKDYDTDIALRLRQDVDFSHEGGSRKETVDDDGNIQVKTQSSLQKHSLH